MIVVSDPPCIHCCRRGRCHRHHCRWWRRRWLGFYCPPAIRHRQHFSWLAVEVWPTPTDICSSGLIIAVDWIRTFFYPVCKPVLQGLPPPPVQFDISVPRVYNKSPVTTVLFCSSPYQSRRNVRCPRSVPTLAGLTLDSG